MTNIEEFIEGLKKRSSWDNLNEKETWALQAMYKFNQKFASLPKGKDFTRWDALRETGLILADMFTGATHIPWRQIIQEALEPDARSWDVAVSAVTETGKDLLNIALIGFLTDHVVLAVGKASLHISNPKEA